jgi:hypothetical protein
VAMLQDGRRPGQGGNLACPDAPGRGPLHSGLHTGHYRAQGDGGQPAPLRGKILQDLQPGPLQHFHLPPA